MNRRDRLKLTNTPEKKTSSNLSRLNIYQNNLNSDQIFSREQKNKIFTINPEKNEANKDKREFFLDSKSHFNNITKHKNHLNDTEKNKEQLGDDFEDSLFDIQPEKQISSKFKKMFLFFKNAIWNIIKYLYIVIPYVFIVYLYFNSGESNIKINELQDLKSQINILREQNVKLKKVEQISNLCKIEKGTYVEVDSKNIYKHGILGFRKFIDPNVIFKDGQNECLAFVGSKSLFYINFSKILMFDNFCIYHPQTTNMKSKIKKLKLTGYLKNSKNDLGEFEFSNANYQIFRFKKNYYDKIKVEILENYGFKKYTTLYKVFIFGVYE